MHENSNKIHWVKSAIREKIEENLSEKSRKIIKIGFLILLVIAFIPEVYLVPYYFVVIKPSAETEINQILDKVHTVNSTDEKVTLISDWQEQNYTNIYGIEPNASLDIIWYPFLKTGRYPIYYNGANGQSIKIRAILSPFSNDPFWITYYHSGACGELASLFDYVANKSSVESRIVHTKGEDHAWVEVKTNDTWYYFDPTLVEIYQREDKYRDKWFSTPDNFEAAWTWNVSRVNVLSTDEDITTNYTQTANVSVILNSTKDITLSKFDNGKKEWKTLLTKNIPELKNQTIEEFYLGESNRYKIRASNYGSLLPIPRYQEQEFFLNSTGNISITMNPDNGEVDFGLLITISVILFVVLWYEAKWIRGWFGKKEENGEE